MSLVVGSACRRAALAGVSPARFTQGFTNVPPSSMVQIREHQTTKHEGPSETNPSTNASHGPIKKSTTTKYNKVIPTETEGSNSKRWLHYNSEAKPTPNNVRERNTTVTSYYNQTAIDNAAAKQSVRLTPATIMYAGHSVDGSHVMVSFLKRHLQCCIRRR